MWNTNLIQEMRTRNIHPNRQNNYINTIRVVENSVISAFGVYKYQIEIFIIIIIFVNADALIVVSICIAILCSLKLKWHWYGHLWCSYKMSVPTSAKNVFYFREIVRSHWFTSQRNPNANKLESGTTLKWFISPPFARKSSAEGFRKFS